MPAAHRIDRSVFEDDAFDPDLRQLYDFAEVTDIRLTSAGVRHLARTTEFSPLARRAILVASDVAFGMARMYAMLSDQSDDTFRIFRDRAEATEWLRQK